MGLFSKSVHSAEKELMQNEQWEVVKFSRSAENTININ